MYTNDIASNVISVNWSTGYSGMQKMLCIHSIYVGENIREAILLYWIVILMASILCSIISIQSYTHIPTTLNLYYNHLYLSYKWLWVLVITITSLLTYTLVSLSLRKHMHTHTFVTNMCYSVYLHGYGLENTVLEVIRKLGKTITK